MNWLALMIWKVTNVQFQGFPPAFADLRHLSLLYTGQVPCYHVLWMIFFLFSFFFFLDFLGTIMDSTGTRRIWAATRDPGYPVINRKHDKCRLWLCNGSVKRLSRLFSLSFAGDFTSANLRWIEARCCPCAVASQFYGLVSFRMCRYVRDEMRKPYRLWL